MGTVLVDRYRVICQRCSYDREFMIGAGRGSYDAVKEAQLRHESEAATQRNCPDDNELLVMILEKG